MILPLLLVALTFEAAPTRSLAQTSEANVTLPNGAVVRGFIPWGNGTRVFLGIPYAEPPVGDLRWRPPVKWKSTKEISAKDWAPNCLQDNSGGLAWPSLAGETNAEDCLYLNVFSPVSIHAAIRRPTMIFIHGGAYSWGGARDNELAGAAMVALADVVLVTLNYRLGVLGFLGSDALRRRDVKSRTTGNYGLQDQRLAMKWVKANIAVFGGDAERVMIFGESAGAGSVSVHLAARRSWGLFARAAMQSGGFQNWAAKSITDAEKNMNKLLEATNCHKTSDSDPSKRHQINCLLAMNGSALVNATTKVKMPSTDSWDHSMWAPVVDGVELLDHPIDALKSGALAPNIPMILGTNKDEGTDFINYTHSSTLDWTPDWFSRSDAAHTDFIRWARQNFGEQAAPIIERLYRVGKPGTGVKGSPPLYHNYWAAAAGVIGDYMMTCPNRRAAYWHVSKDGRNGRNGTHTYVYVFGELPRDAPQDDGVFHGAEIRFVFFDEFELTGWKEKQLGLQMVRFWTNMAATGDPNSRPPVNSSSADSRSSRGDPPHLHARRRLLQEQESKNSSVGVVPPSGGPHPHPHPAPPHPPHPPHPVPANPIWGPMWPPFETKDLGHVMQFTLNPYKRDGVRDDFCDFWDSQPYPYGGATAALPER